MGSPSKERRRRAFATKKKIRAAIIQMAMIGRGKEASCLRERARRDRIRAIAGSDRRDVAVENRLGVNRTDVKEKE